MDDRGDILVETFESPLKGWMGWAPEGHAAPEIETLAMDTAAGQQVGVLHFPYGPGPKVVQKTLQKPPGEVAAISFWAKREGSGKLNIGVRTREGLLYTAELKGVDQQWQKWTLALSQFQGRDGAEGTELLPQEVAAILITLWRPPETPTDHGEPIRLYLDQVMLLATF